MTWCDGSGRRMIEKPSSGERVTIPCCFNAHVPCLRCIAQQRHQLDEWETERVSGARAAGRSWQQIADDLGRGEAPDHLGTCSYVVSHWSGEPRTG